MMFKLLDGCDDDNFGHLPFDLMGNFWASNPGNMWETDDDYKDLAFSGVWLFPDWIISL